MNLGETALYAAAASGRLPICQLLLRHGAQVRRDDPKQSCEDLKESSPLHIAITEGHYSIVELLLNHIIGPPHILNARDNSSDGTNGNSIIDEPCDNLGRPPLSVAAAEGQVGVMELLLARNADIEAKSKGEGISSLSWAIIGNLFILFRHAV